MKIPFFRRRLERQPSLTDRPLPLSSLHFIGRIFLTSIFALCLLWMVDTVQQNDVLHLLTGGERALEQMSVEEGALERDGEGGLSHSYGHNITRGIPERAPDADRQKMEATIHSWLKGVFGTLRVPALLLVGIIIPLGLFLWNWESAIYADTLQPYLMLLGAQAGTLIVGLGLLGEGTVPFIGTVYSLLRVWQIDGLLEFRKRGCGEPPRLLRIVLRAAQVLWALNWIALLVFILWVMHRKFQVVWALGWIALNVVVLWPMRQNSGWKPLGGTADQIRLN